MSLLAARASFSSIEWPPGLRLRPQPQQHRAPPLHAIHGVPGLLIAVGASGRIEVSQDGLSFRRILSFGAPLADLLGVSVASPTCAFACGARGALLRWDGRAFSSIDSSTRRDLLCTACRGPDDAWFGGGGFVLRYERGLLTRYPVPFWVRAIACPPDNGGGDDGEAWFLGTGRVGLRFRGGAFQRITIAAPDEVRVVGTGGLAGSLFGLAAAASDDVWVAGSDGAILHWNGTGWDRVESATRAVISALCLGPSAEPWVATGTGQLRHLVNRAVWSVAADLAPLGTWPQSICAVAGQIFLCTEGAILRYPIRERS